MIERAACRQRNPAARSRRRASSCWSSAFTVSPRSPREVVRWLTYQRDFGDLGSINFSGLNPQGGFSDLG